MAANVLLLWANVRVHEVWPSFVNVSVVSLYHLTFYKESGEGNQGTRLSR